VIVEYIRYHIAPEQAEEFVKAYDAAGEVLDASPHCKSYDVSRCSEDAEQFIVRIIWDSAEGHLKGFRGSPEFQRFFTLVRPFFAGIAEMRHYEPVLSREYD
jgi:quinol monooxygenase YgiN